MKERPILFNSDMVRALLAGHKTQTRRVVKPQPIADRQFSGGHYIPPSKRTEGALISVEAPYVGIACRHGQTGDRLWVREAHAVDGNRAFYRAGHAEAGGSGPRVDVRWRPSIHMPRWASRITLEITEVRVERLQDISRGDAMAEGCLFPNMAQGHDPRTWYAELWNVINGPDSWAANPWVWAVTFKKVATA